MNIQDQLNELRGLAARAENRRTETGIPRVAMVQGAVPEHELAAVYDPMINMILRGSKTMTVGNRTLRYDPATYFVISIDLPAIGTVHAEPDGSPYLAISLTLEAAVIADLLQDLPCLGSAHAGADLSAEAGFSVASVTCELMDAWVRMLRLIDRPDDVAALAPAYEREILYLVLRGSQGRMLRDIALPDSTLARVNKAIQRIRRDFARPLRMEKLADEAAMSLSAFHRHFKAVTALSPLQYQKQLRLLRARTLLISEGRTVMSVALEVGYESPTQFSREYSRAFGLPPTQDVSRSVSCR